LTTPVRVRAKISALGTYVPPRLLTNADLEKMVDTSNDWIMSRVGIRERHIVDKGVATSDLAIEAAQKALQERGIPGTEIEAIFVGTVTPDMLFPATACIVQDKIGAKGAWGYDISAACSGFVYSLQTAVKFVESGAHKRVLAIGADVMTSIINYQDRATCIIFGDGAGAVLVEPDFRLLAGGGDLRLGHLGSQPFESRFAVLVALGERERGPEVGFGQILRNSTPRPVVGAERSLRGDMPLVGGAQEPLHGLHVIPRNALSVMVANAHLPLRVGVSLTGELSQVWQGLRLRALICRTTISRALIGCALP